jgi:hypothetical protein
MDSNHPFEISQETDDSDIDNYRTLSIVKYITNTTYDSNEIISKFSTNKLNPTTEFGCVYPKKFNNHVHVLFGKLGTKTLTGLATDSDNNTVLQRYNFSRVIVATMYIDHFSEASNLALIVFRGGKISTDLWHAAYRNLLNIYDLKPVKFSEKKIRKMCFDKYRDSLLEIKFDPASEEEFGNIKFAEYKSVRSKKFNPSAKKIQEIIDNDEIKVNRFKSVISATYEDLDRSYQIPFAIDIEGKVTLEFPKISWSLLKDNYDIEEHYYSFAEKIYNEIISEDIYRKEEEESKSQKSLFDF